MAKKKGEQYQCDACGLVVNVLDPFGCEACELVCCAQPIKPIKAASQKAPAKVKKK